MSIRFKKLTIHNFFMVKHLVIDLSRKGIHYIHGRNGAGKSTIFAALCWCLYNKYPGSGAKVGDEIVNPLEKHDCWVELELSDAAGEFVLKRARMEGPKHKDAKFYINFDGEEKEFDLRKTDVSDSNEFIVALLDRNYDLFTRQRFFAQEGVEPVTRMKDAALKAFFLENVLNIEWTGECLQKAKDEKKTLNESISLHIFDADASKKMVKLHSDNVKEYRVKMLEQDDKDRQRKAEIDADIKEYAGLLTQAKKRNAQLDKEVEKIEKKYKKQILDLEKQLNKLGVAEDFGREIEALEREYRQVSLEAQRAGDTITRSKGEVDRLTRKIEAAREHLGEPCESCGTTITEEHLPYMVKEIAAQIESIQVSIPEDENKKGKLVGKSQAILGKLEALKKKRDAQKDLVTARADLRVKIAGINGEKSLEIKEINEDRIDLSSIAREIDSLSNELNRKNDNPYVDSWQKERSRMVASAKDVRRALSEVQKLREEMEVVEFWVKGFSSQGIQSFLLDDITPTINRYVAKYMAHLADSRIMARLHTVKRLKTGEFRENFGVEINALEGGKTFASLSGGEKRRVDLAVSLAVADFQRSMSAKDMDFLLFDETTGMMDTGGEETFYAMIKKYFSHIPTFVITHKPIDKTDFDYEYVVEKRNGTTQLVEIGA